MTDDSGVYAMWTNAPASNGIPDDVMLKARPALAYAMTAASEGDDQAAIAIIGKAILAERERCAKVADAVAAMRERLFLAAGGIGNAHRAVQAEELSAAIRRGAA